MAKIVRVSRDGSKIVAKTDHGAYVVATNSGVEREHGVRDELAPLVANGSWRRPVSSDNAKFEHALTLANGGVVASSAAIVSDRAFRVPPTIRRSIAQALEEYSSLLSDSDRAVALRLATHTTVSREDIEWMHKFYQNVQKALALHGGKKGQTWSEKVLSSAEETITASAFEANPDFVYFAGGDDPDSTLVDTLYAVEYDDEGEDWDEDSLFIWKNGEFEYVGEADELERELLIELDVEAAQALADYLDSNATTDENVDGDLPPRVAPFELRNIDPIERNLFELAEAEIDWELIDNLATIVADATGYSPAERIQNAQRQPRSNGGRFGGAPAPVGQTLTAGVKARLAQELPLVEDPGALVSEYLASFTGEAPVEAPEDTETVTAAATPDNTASPLYLARVDAADKTAVLDVYAVVPATGDTDALAYTRVDGEWVASPDILDDIRGVTPPPLVHLAETDTIKDILTQVDAHDDVAPSGDDEDEEVVAASAFEMLSDKSKEKRDKLAKKGYALPDGSFPIESVSDLEKAVKAYGRAKDKAAARRHIKKRARALNRYDLVPEDWKTASIQELFDDSHLSPLYGPHGEIIASVVAAGVPGIADTPSDKAAVERLYQYWTAGKGAAKIRWGTKGDLTRCHRQLSKYVGPNRAWGLCQNYHKRIFGVPNATRDKAAGE